MELIIDWLSFFGAWLLVAGPIYQAALELHDEDIQEERIRAAGAKVAKPVEASAWWWLLPPAKLFLEGQRRQQFNQAVLDALHPEDFEALVAFRNKAAGWVFIASGAFLIAVKETYELSEHYEVSLPFFLIVICVLFFLSIYNTVYRIKKTEETIRLRR